VETTEIHIYDIMTFVTLFMVWCFGMEADFNCVWHLFPVQAIVNLGEQDLTKAVIFWRDLQPESPKDV
jgi:hypothetical protein